MLVLIASCVAWFLYGYLAVGIVLLPWWQLKGLARLDAATAHAPWGFRVLVSPGLIALWPFLLSRAIKGTGHPPVERNAHRCAANEVAL